MFTFDKNRKEEKAVQTLLRLSECEDVENKLNCLVGASDISSFRNSASLRKKSKSDQSQNADFQLSPWEGPFAENTESRTSSISTLEQQQYTKKEQHKQSPKPRPEASTKHTAAVTRSVRFSKNQMAKDNALFLKDDENVKFYHLDDAHEYMTQYRETVTFSTMLEYRKSLVTSLPITLREKCEKSRSPYDLVKHCHCSGHSSISSSVCYTTECDAAFARQLLSVTSLARIKKKNDRNFSKNKQDKVEQKSGRKTSGSKLRMKGKMKRAASNYVKTNQYPRVRSLSLFYLFAIANGIGGLRSGRGDVTFANA